MNIDVPIGNLCAEVDGLITIDQACARARRYVDPITTNEVVNVLDAPNRTLAESVVATVAMPPFDQSAMDGYALALEGEMVPAGARVPVTGRIAAGHRAGVLLRGRATRIFTGAPLPHLANAVVMQEHAALDAGFLTLNRCVRYGDNIRRHSEDIAKGDPLLSVGEQLDARHVALLCAQGRTEVCVRKRIRVGIVSTGNELCQPGAPLSNANIYDSNRPMLLSLARDAGLDAVDGGCVADDPQAIAMALRRLAERCDLLVTTGGASVGEEDHSARAMASSGSEFETLRIALKPGKPAVVGRINGCGYIGLPGNAVSALISWLIIGGAMISRLAGRASQRRAGCPMRAASTFARRPGRTEFAPARIVNTDTGGTVELLGGGGSARLRPLVLADGLAEIAALHAPVEMGDIVLFHPFRNGFTI